MPKFYPEMKTLANIILAVGIILFGVAILFVAYKLHPAIFMVTLSGECIVIAATIEEFIENDKND